VYDGVDVFDNAELSCCVAETNTAQLQRKAPQFSGNFAANTRRGDSIGMSATTHGR
jgi:hypothetical protein